MSRPSVCGGVQHCRYRLRHHSEALPGASGVVELDAPGMEMVPAVGGQGNTVVGATDSVATGSTATGTAAATATFAALALVAPGHASALVQRVSDQWMP